MLADDLFGGAVAFGLHVTPEKPAPVIEGWKNLFNSRKEHYFIDGRSLCGRWMTLGSGGVTKTPSGWQYACKSCKQRAELRSQKETQ